MLLLELPQFGVDVKGPPKVRLPLFVSILRKVPAGKTPQKKRQETTEELGGDRKRLSAVPESSVGLSDGLRADETETKTGTG